VTHSTLQQGIATALFSANSLRESILERQAFLRHVGQDPAVVLETLRDDPYFECTDEQLALLTGTFRWPVAGLEGTEVERQQDQHFLIDRSGNPLTRLPINPPGSLAAVCSFLFQYSFSSNFLPVRTFHNPCRG